ncbi:hypothetical protein [Massilia niabensis]|uniref:Uncharacterized protein n=1 Tax=Massilia niabensis TaxID=544910 RepID=A0ABW0KZG9_9BURK
MDDFDRPSKEQIRSWMRKRWEEWAPLPDAATLRQQVLQERRDPRWDTDRSTPPSRRPGLT